MNLSVINYPDSLGTTCGYAPFSFYLGGKRTYYGLPNNPDYEMPALAGSACDSLTGMPHLNPPRRGGLYVFYHAGWEKAFINAQGLRGKTFSLQVYDMMGNRVYSEAGKINPPYFTRDLNCTAFAKGMYVVTLQTEKERLVRKFVKE